MLPAIVTLKSTVPSEARSARNPGTEREGHGVVIDDEGLVLTVGYLVLEANSVEIVDNNGRRSSALVVAFDNDSGGCGIMGPRPKVVLGPKTRSW